MKSKIASRKTWFRDLWCHALTPTTRLVNALIPATRPTYSSLRILDACVHIQLAMMFYNHVFLDYMSNGCGQVGRKLELAAKMRGKPDKRAIYRVKLIEPIIYVHCHLEFFRSNHTFSKFRGPIIYNLSSPIFWPVYMFGEFDHTFTIEIQINVCVLLCLLCTIIEFILITSIDYIYYNE